MTTLGKVLIGGGAAVGAYFLLGGNTPANPLAAPVNSLAQSAQNLISPGSATPAPATAAPAPAAAVTNASGATVYSAPGTPQSLTTATPLTAGPWTNTAAISAGNPTGYIYLVNGAPLPIPSGYDSSYYATYIYPAMVQANGNVGSKDFVFPNGSGFADQYLANYVDVQQWLASFKIPLPMGERQHNQLVYHWQTYGAIEQRTFLPLPWQYPVNWVPPPPKVESGLDKVLTVALQVATEVGGVVASPVTGGASVYAAQVAVAAESQIKGVNEPVDYGLNDTEIECVITGAAVANQILPLFANVAPNMVNAIYDKMASIVNSYN